MSQGGSGEDGVEENMAAWLLGINNLKIQPFHLPPLGIPFSSYTAQLPAFLYRFFIFLNFFNFINITQLFLDVEFQDPMMLELR